MKALIRKRRKEEGKEIKSKLQCTLQKESGTYEKLKLMKLFFISKIYTTKSFYEHCTLIHLKITNFTTSRIIKYLKK